MFNASNSLFLLNEVKTVLVSLPHTDIWVLPYQDKYNQLTGKIGLADWGLTFCSADMPL
jgi:hypothetical protein